MVPYYLAIGSVVVEAGSDAGPYHVYGMQLPAPSEDGRGGFNPAVRTIRVRVTGANPGAVSDSAAALRQQCVRDKLVTLQSATGRAIMTSRIREAAVVESDFDPLDRSTATGPKMYLTLTLTTDAHWLAPWGNWVTIAIPAPAPGHFDIPAAGGETDALVSLRLIPGIDTNGIYVGGQPNPAAGYDYLDDSYTGSMEVGPTWTRYVTGAVNINALANKGRHLPLVYCESPSVVVSTMSVRSGVATLGYNIDGLAGLSEGLPRVSDTQGMAVELREVTVPSSALPSINGDSFVFAHYIDFMDDNLPWVALRNVQRIPLDYAAVAYRAVSAAGVGIVYDGDTDCVHTADTDGIGGSVLSATDIIRPLRAAPDAVTRIVYGITAPTYSVAASLYTLAYRTRRRYLSATG